jgi:hypothetical protein
MTKKPSGTSGAVRPSVGNDGRPKIEHLTIQWPTEQKEIERKILGFFTREFEKAGAKFLDIEDGGVSGLDFLLTLPGGKTWLELMEVVAPRKGEKPHGPGQQAHMISAYVDQVFEGVMRKTGKYGFRHECPVHLLLNTTHEQYVPSPSAIEMLKVRFREVKHSFENVFLITPLSEDVTPLTVLFNKHHPVSTEAKESVAGSWWISLPGSETKLY